ARHKTYTAHNAGADEFVRYVDARQRSNLEKVGAFIEQHLDTFAWEKSASGDVTFDVLFAAAFGRTGEFAFQFFDRGGIGSVVGLICWILRVNDRFDRLHVLPSFVAVPGEN